MANCLVLFAQSIVQAIAPACSARNREVVMLRKLAVALAGAALAATLTASAFAADKPTMGVVVKIGGIPWFNAMETGIKENGAKLGVDAAMIGPTSADPARQLRRVENRTPKNVSCT